MCQSKDLEWEEEKKKDIARPNRDKNEIHIYAAYKKLTSDMMTHRLIVKGWGKVFHSNEMKRRLG